MLHIEVIYIKKNTLVPIRMLTESRERSNNKTNTRYMFLYE